LAAAASDAAAKMRALLEGERAASKAVKREEEEMSKAALEAHDAKVRALVEQIRREKEAGVEAPYDPAILGPNVAAERVQFEARLAAVDLEMRGKAKAAAQTSGQAEGASDAGDASDMSDMSDKARQRRREAEEARVALAERGIVPRSRSSKQPAPPEPPSPPEPLAPPESTRPSTEAEADASMADASVVAASMADASAATEGPGGVAEGIPEVGAATTGVVPVLDAATAVERSPAEMASAAGIAQLLAYRVFKGNEQWRVRWQECGEEDDTWEAFGVIDTETLRRQAEQLKAEQSVAIRE